MNLETVISNVRKLAADADVSHVDFMAVQVTLTDCDPGMFYVEVKDHKVNVEPYDYHDRNCAISMKSDDFNKLISGEIDPVAAFTVGKLKVDGDSGKALEFSNLLK